MANEYIFSAKVKKNQSRNNLLLIEKQYKGKPLSNLAILNEGAFARYDKDIQELKEGEIYLFSSSMYFPAEKPGGYNLIDIFGCVPVKTLKESKSILKKLEKRK